MLVCLFVVCVLVTNYCPPQKVANELSGCPSLNMNNPIKLNQIKSCTYTSVLHHARTLLTCTDVSVTPCTNTSMSHLLSHRAQTLLCHTFCHTVHKHFCVTPNTSVSHRARALLCTNTSVLIVALTFLATKAHCEGFLDVERPV